MTSGSRRARRADAMDNRSALLDAASRVLVSRGPGAPMELVAAEAGVGIGTLYRNFSDRTALFDAVSVRSYERIEQFATQAVQAIEGGAPALEAIALFFDRILEHREYLALPLLGTPAPQRAAVTRIGERISTLMDAVLAHGVAEGTVRADAVASDLVVGGAMLAHQLLLADAWELAARRIRNLLLDGLRASPDHALTHPLERADLDASLARSADDVHRGCPGQRNTSERSRLVGQVP